MQDYAKLFYQSKVWKQCRKGYVKSIGGLCEECLKAGRITPCEIVHHKVFITPKNIYNPEITLNYENLVALCRKCHGEKHSKSVKRYEIDSKGHVVGL